MHPHAPHDRERAPDEHQLHQGIIHRDEVREQIQVPRQKHRRVELLGLQGHPGARFGGVDLEEEDDDTDEVGHVAGESEDVHGCRRRRGNPA